MWREDRVKGRRPEADEPQPDWDEHHRTMRGLALHLHRVLEIFVAETIRHQTTVLEGGERQPIPQGMVAGYVDNTANASSTTVQIGTVHFVIPANSGGWIPVAGATTVLASQSVTVLWTSSLLEAAISL